ncbi:MAG: hypothetical protein HOG55_06145, partial [Anaerolineae bacterium]|nr:hypothetical protein [Anaerolineae bacterium]
MKKSIRFIFSSLFFLSACGSTPTAAPANPPVDIAATALVAAKTSIAETQAALPTKTETPIPTPTEIPFFLTATVWAKDARVPIINYHQFAPNTSLRSTDHKIRKRDFLDGLEALNQAGFTLIHLEDWINGDL